MKEYRLAKGWTLFFYILCPLCIILVGWFFYLPFEKEEPNWSLFFILGPIALGLIALFGIGLVEIRKGKFVIDHDRVYTQDVFGGRMLLLEEIKGYHTDDKYIYIQPIDNKKKRVKVSTYYGNKEEIVEWLSSRYPDVVALAQQMEEEAILNDEELGKTVEERELKLKSAKRIAQVLNISGGVVLALAYFWPHFYEVLLLSAMILFVVTLAVLKLNGKLMRLGLKNTAAYPSLFGVIFCTSCALALRALFDYEMYEYDPFWLPFVGLAVLILTVILIGNTELDFKKVSDYFICLLLLVFAAAYSYGSIIFLNCYYDKSELKAYTARVENMWISSGKTQTYHLLLSPWATRKGSESVTVSKELYDTIEPSQDVTVYLGKGELGIPWFFVGQ